MGCTGPLCLVILKLSENADQVCKAISHMISCTEMRDGARVWISLYSSFFLLLKQLFMSCLCDRSRTILRMPFTSDNLKLCFVFSTFKRCFISTFKCSCSEFCFSFLTLQLILDFLHLNQILNWTLDFTATYSEKDIPHFFPKHTFSSSTENMRQYSWIFIYIKV